MSKKIAVLIGSSEFPKSNNRLSVLKCPLNDVDGLRRTLRTPKQLDFNDDDIHVLRNEPSPEVLNRINQVFVDANREDLVLIYYSGHGKTALDGSLYLTCHNTNVDLLIGSAVDVASIAKCASMSRCQRVILILDCCYSGAAGEILSKGTVDERLQQLAQKEEGRGKFVMTSSTATQISTEKEGEQYSVFTKHLINGLNGAGDLDGDGLIAMEELSCYVQREVAKEAPHTPMHWSADMSGTLIIGETADGVDGRLLREQIRRTVDGLSSTDFFPNSIAEAVYTLLELPDGELRGKHHAHAELMTNLARRVIPVKVFIEKWMKLKAPLPFVEEPSEIQVEDRWEHVREARQHVFDLNLPSYLLSSKYRFLDWNPLFDEIIAKPLGLTRGSHAEDFVLELDNSCDVIERSRSTFKIGEVPSVDYEELRFDSSKFGMITFHKLASQISADNGEILAWSVCLNITSAEKWGLLWKHIGLRLDREVNWSKYAISYDKILLHFDKYLELIKAVVGMAGSAQVCADLGAGTGNVSFELLGASPTREVWAYESNEAMLERMRAKLKKRPEIVDRLFVVKGDALLSLREKGEGEFDAAFMVNSLYAMEDKEFCLREVYRVLKPNGVLVLSTPHNETDVLRLFAAIKACLAGKNLHEELRPHLEDAYARHLQMDQAIHEHTKKSTFQMIEAAGFRIEETIDPAYVGAVVIVRAVKRAEK